MGEDIYMAIETGEFEEIWEGDDVPTFEEVYLTHIPHNKM
ncbi:MAG: hypothetical protein Fur006_11830 [Coleofasciculaceae cyanobacterium]